MSVRILRLSSSLSSSLSLKLLPRITHSLKQMGNASSSGPGSTLSTKQVEPPFEKATFGAGCFWGTEKFFKKRFGDALSTIHVGYMGGELAQPSYRDVCSGRTGHAEVVQVVYNSEKIKYADLLDLFWRFHDPTTKNRQGNDTGSQYRSVIFFHSPEQERLALETKTKYQTHWPKPIVTEISPAGDFWIAEDYHQAYLDHNPGGYECPSHRMYF